MRARSRGAGPRGAVGAGRWDHVAGVRRLDRALRRTRTSVVAAVSVLTAALSCAGAHAGPITETGCDDLTAANADFEAYGPTDVDAQAGDGHVTVGENGQGTVTVFKWPNPSYYNQVKYVAVGRDAHGRALAQFPNEGVFAGVRWTTASGGGFAWLRDWPSRQRYDSNDTPVPLTRWRAPGDLGLVVSAYDLAAGDAFERQFVVRREPGSPVRSVTLVAFENLNPIATRLLYLPIADWCVSQLSDQQARYDAQQHAIVHAWRGMDAASGRPASVALAAGFDGADTEHEVGGDGSDPASLPGQPPDGYRDGGCQGYRVNVH